MPSSRAAGSISWLQEERARLAEMLTEVDSAIKALRRYDELASEGRSHVSRPGTADAILTVLDAAVDPLEMHEILGLLAERGWSPNSDKPENSVRSTLNRLRKEQKVIDVGHKYSVP